jgi:RND family efflux transporter MFP subunit
LSPSLRRRLSIFGVLLAYGVTSACQEEQALPAKPRPSVLATTARSVEFAEPVTLTGEIKARIESKLSFRVTGRIVERTADVGDHVDKGQVIARLDPAEQQAGIQAAQAGVDSSTAQTKLASANFDRQRALLAKGFTTKREYDLAEQALKTAESALDSSRADRATARDALSYTELRADAAGFVSARSADVGQVAQAAQSIFTIAEDGPRDAVFDVPESLLLREFVSTEVEVSLVTNPKVSARGEVREVSPSVDSATGTVRAKIGLDKTPPAMSLGAVVSGSGQLKGRKVIVLPWSAISSLDRRPAVWVVDPVTQAVALKTVSVDNYQSARVMIKAGLAEGDLVVIAGAKLLRPNLVVAVVKEANS